jgi:hypothetical protein
MAVFEKGNFSLDLGFVSLGGDLSDADRQCAWELYTEIATRVAVVGKRGDAECKDFSGELYSESLDSLIKFFQECRGIMRQFPVGRIKDPRQIHLGILINRILARILRPFLETSAGKYRAWWANQPKEGSPYEIQKQYPDAEKFLKDWADVRVVMREVETKLAEQYKLVPLD